MRPQRSDTYEIDDTIVLRQLVVSSGTDMRGVSSDMLCPESTLPMAFISVFFFPLWSFFFSFNSHAVLFFARWPSL